MLNLSDQNAAKSSIEKILEFLKVKNYEQLWLNASIRLCKIYLDRKEFDKFQHVKAKLLSAKILVDRERKGKLQTSRWNWWYEEIWRPAGNIFSWNWSSYANYEPGQDQGTLQ